MQSGWLTFGLFMFSLFPIFSTMAKLSPEAKQQTIINRMRKWAKTKTGNKSWNQKWNNSSGDNLKAETKSIKFLKQFYKDSRIGVIKTKKKSFTLQKGERGRARLQSVKDQ